MKSYDVYITLPNGDELNVGTLNSDGNTSQFKYNDAYQSDSRAISIDPLNLPLSGIVYTKTGDIFNIFNDSLPDQWGVRMMVKKHHISRFDQSSYKLLQHLDNEHFGALSYSPKGKIKVLTEIIIMS